MSTIAVLGTGTVGRTLATALVGLGHTVLLGSRDGTTGADWIAGLPEAVAPRARLAAFADAASESGDLVVSAVKGEYALDVLTAVGPERLADKVLLDVSNPLDFSQGFPPSLIVGSTTSLSEQIQAALPGTHVVKALNTVTAALMVNPGLVPRPHTVFMAGNDATAKDRVVALLEDFGWERAEVLDLGDITAARGSEAYLLLWVRILMAEETALFNVRVVRE